MPQGSLSLASYRSDHRLHISIRVALFPRCLLWLSPDPDDKFTKWIEAKPVATASSEVSVEFIKEVINRYGTMNMIITDNGTQFTGSAFVNFSDKQQINIIWAIVAHPKTNGQVERANGCILRGLKP